MSNAVARLLFGAVGLALALATPGLADEFDLGSITIASPDGDIRAREFRRNVLAGLRTMQDKNPYLAQILKAAQGAPFPVTVHPITEDPSTYFQGRQPFRPHARAAGPRSVSADGVAGYPALVYLTFGMVNPYSWEYKRGVLAHELVHAVDLAYGRVHPNRAVRERRAMFVENLWRDAQGWVLADYYFDRDLPTFETLDYQRAKRSGTIARCVEVLLTVSSFDCS